MTTTWRGGGCAFAVSTRPLAMEQHHLSLDQAEGSQRSLDPLVTALVAAIRGLERLIDDHGDTAEDELLELAA